jgi:hypothetical protein
MTEATDIKGKLSRGTWADIMPSKSQKEKLRNHSHSPGQDYQNRLMI